MQAATGRVGTLRFAPPYLQVGLLCFGFFRLLGFLGFFDFFTGSAGAPHSPA
jgi:hypothetical protein